MRSTVLNLLHPPLSRCGRCFNRPGERVSADFRTVESPLWPPGAEYDAAAVVTCLLMAGAVRPFPKSASSHQNTEAAKT